MPLSVLAVGENKMTIESNNKAHHKDTQKERIKKKKKNSKAKIDTLNLELCNEKKTVWAKEKRGWFKKRFLKLIKQKKPNEKSCSH